MGVSDVVVVMLIVDVCVQSMLKDDELFKEINSSPNPSVTDDDSNV